VVSDDPFRKTIEVPAHARFGMQMRDSDSGFRIGMRDWDAGSGIRD
jgi:hypothetical protein